MRLLLVLAALLLATLFAGCSDDPTETDVVIDDPGSAVADSIATYWMEAMTDTIRAWDDREMEMVDIRDLTLTEVRTGFEAALAEESGHATGHLGLAIVSLLEMNYSTQFWAFVDSLDSYIGDDDNGPMPPIEGFAYPLRDGVVGHQFRILAEAPLSLINQSMSLPDNVTVAEMQRILNEDLMPLLAESISHLAAVEADQGFSFEGELDSDAFEIDLGEVYFFDASLHCLRAGLRVMLGYNLEPVDGDGTYDWIEEMDDYNEYYNFYIVEDRVPTDFLHRFEVWDSVKPDSLLMTVLQANMEEGGPFLTLRIDPYSGETMLQEAGADLNTALDKLQAGLDYIRAEGDDQSDDIIELGFLTDLDQDIDDCVDCPNFAAGWDEIEDVIDWIETVLGGSYLLEEEIDGRAISVTVDLYQLFSSPVADWKTLLPLHGWKPAEEWVHREWYQDWSHDWNSHTTYQFYVREDGMDDEQLVLLDGISLVIFYGVNEWMDEPLFMIDESEDPLLDGVLPYFDDYTFNGLLPGMTRAELATLMDMDQ